MNPLGTVILNLLENVSLLAFVAAGYVALRRRARLPRSMVGPAIGVLFGLGAVLAMTFRIAVIPGVFADGRNIMTSLAAVFGGPVATLVTVAITVAYRVWLGGSGVYSGIAAAIASGLTGLAFCALQRRTGFALRGGALLALGAAVVAVSAIAFVLFNPAQSPSSLLALVVPLLLVTPLGTVLLGLALQGEDERRALQDSVHRSDRRLKEAIDAMENGFALFDAEDRLVAYNDGFMNAQQRAEFGDPIGHTFEALTRAFVRGQLTAVDAAADPEAWVNWRLEVHRNPPTTPVEIQWNDGRWMRVTERRTAEGGYVGVWTDITASKTAETRLREAVESIPEGFVLMDADLKIKIFNRRMLELYPASAPAFAVGRPFAEVLRYGAEHGEYPGVSSSAEAEGFVRQWIARFSGDEPYFGEGAFRDGRWVLVSHRRTAGGDYVSIRTDITAQKQRERELATLLEELIESQAATERAHDSLERSSALLRAITDAVPALVAYVDRDECYRYCNKEYRDIFGVEPESLVGQRIVDAVEPEVYKVVKPQIDRALAGAEVSFVRPLIAKGVIHYVEQRYIPNVAADGNVDGFYAMAWDITESHNRELALNREAVTDPLTGLLNRRGVTDALLEYARTWREGGSAGAVLYLDIDRFKQINDTMGHDVGDALIKAFADRLRGIVRASDTVARQGGDEFVILLNAPEAEEIAKRIATTLLERVRQPVILGERVINISTSIGIAVIRPGAAASDLEMMKQADMALYEAKAAGRDRYCLRRVG